MPVAKKTRTARSNVGKTKSKPKPKTKTSAKAKPNAEVGESFAGISDAAVTKGTGAGWAHWFKVLDAFDVKAKGHAPAAKFLKESEKLPAWWSQMVVVGYEQGRGLREKNERKKGFAAGVTRTMDVPLKKVWKFWQPGGKNARWLGAEHTKKAGEKRSWLRLRWEDGTDVTLTFTAQPGGKTQIAAEQEGLKSKSEVTEIKAFWKFRLELLAAQMGCESEVSDWFGKLGKL